jgi:threonine 3-dehydrogenase
MANKGLVIDLSNQSWDDSRGFTLTDLPMPVLDEAQNSADAASVILKIRYAGVCGSDLGLWNRTAFKDMFVSSLKRDGKTQRVVGHEFVGEIVEAGSMVKSLYSDPDPQNLAKIEVGSLVSGDSHVTCGRCHQCRLGEGHVCLDEAILGISIDGIFAEYVKIPAKNLWSIDESRVRPEIAAIFDPFGNAVHATTKTDLRGQRVAIFGCGPIGLFSVLLAQNFGAAKVIVADINPANLEMAKKLGADETILIESKQKANDWEHDPEVIDRIMELTYGKGVDVSMEMAGPPSSINNAIDSTRRGGHVILFGIKDGNLTIPDFSRLIVRGLTIHNVIGRKLFHTWQITQRVMSNKKNGIQQAVWDTILNDGHGTILNLTDFTPEAFEAAHKEHPKLLFKVRS